MTRTLRLLATVVCFAFIGLLLGVAVFRGVPSVPGRSASAAEAQASGTPGPTPASIDDSLLRDFQNWEAAQVPAPTDGSTLGFGVHDGELIVRVLASRVSTTPLTDASGKQLRDADGNLLQDATATLSPADKVWHHTGVMLSSYSRFSDLQSRGGFSLGNIAVESSQIQAALSGPASP